MARTVKGKLAQTAAKGDELETLKVLRDEVAAKFPELGPGVIPQFAKMFIDLNQRISALEPKKIDQGVNNDDLRDELSDLLGESTDIDGDTGTA